ncbi:MAG: S9 family peptidase [Planctomycetes bacterium]|nr:S9 family peptidase [Planctomycetota bacterium]
MRIGALLFSACTSAIASSASAQEPLTLEQASGRERGAPSFSTRAENIRWAPDGEHLLRTIGGKEMWVHPLTEKTTEPSPRTNARPKEAPLGPDRGGIISLLQRLDGIDAATADSISRSREQRRATSGLGIAMPYQGKLYLIAGEPDKEVVRVIEPADKNRMELMRVSEAGMFSWVEGNTLCVISDLKNGKVHRFRSPIDDSFSGKLDWVYQEEIYGRGNFLAHWWSPDGERLAWLELDESAVQEFTVIDHDEDDHFRVKPEIYNYPKVGDPNPKVKVQFGDFSGKNPKTTELDLSEYGDQEILVTRVSWTPKGDKMLFVVADRIQTWANLHWFDIKKKKQGVWIREKQSDAWTPRPSEPRWMKDGSFLWESHRTGYNHLYHYSAQGKIIRAITRGDWNLNRILSIDEEAGEMIYTSTEHGAIDVNVYRIDLDGSNKIRLTKGRGSHSLNFNGDGTLALDRVSAIDMPEEVRLVDTKTGNVLKVLAQGSAEATGKTEIANWSVHEIINRDGIPLDVAVLKPGDFDPKKSYAVWVSTYSGPNSPTLRNRWNSSSWLQFLAQNDIIVMQCNVRSASGKGLKWTATAYKQLGVPELHDLEDAVDWLCANQWADESRVGITGYSYGGFISAWAMIASDKFRLAIAGGGVYDWRMYDTIYTERYMQTPSTNMSGYQETSCIKHADDLNPNGYLYIYHGVMDDNVHMQNMMQLALALQKSGKTNWGMMAYPQTRHGIGNRDLRWHSRQVEWKLIKEWLLNKKGSG